MTSDEQEAASFRYVAPRIMVLSSGNIAIIPMIGRQPTAIYSPEEFSLSHLPTMTELELQHIESERLMRARQAPPPRKPSTTLDDLA